MTSVPPGPLAGRYELRERLATSPAAEVFLADDRDLDRPVVVKVLAAGLAADPDVVERFRRAATAAATVRDPNVVTVYDWGDDGGRVFVAMELVDGTDLAETLREARRLSPERTAEVGAAVASGLDAAHRAGVVHGGLTPSDVLLGRNGDVKLCDFGTASAGLAGFASVGTSAAAAEYAAPEQLQGQPADARSDLYTLGTILYEAVTGTLPFVGADVVTLTERKLRERPAPASTHADGVPPALDGIIERLLETEPSRRYASGADVAADLDRLASTLTVPVAAVTAPVVVTTVPEAPTSILPATAAEPEKSSKTPWIVAAIVVLALIVAGLVIWAVTRDDESGKAQVPVPAVVGQPVAAAKAAITAAGLSPTTVNEPNDQFAANLVFQQSPAANDKAAKGSVVVLKVSAGPTTTTTSSTSTTSTTTSTTTTTTTTLPPTTTTTAPPTTTTT